MPSTRETELNSVPWGLNPLQGTDFQSVSRVEGNPPDVGIAFDFKGKKAKRKGRDQDQGQKSRSKADPDTDADPGFTIDSPELLFCIWHRSSPEGIRFIAGGFNHR